MKTLAILLITALTFVACDPMQMVYIQNYTDKDLNLKVKFQKQSADSKRFGVQVKDTLIEKPKSLFHQNNTKKIDPDFTSDTAYQVTLPSNSNCLLGPLTIGFPISKVSLSGKFGHDSILFYGSNSNLKQQIKRGKLKKVNWAFFVYNYKN